MKMYLLWCPTPDPLTLLLNKAQLPAEAFNQFNQLSALAATVG